MAEHQFLAIDLGAESGRGIVATLRDDRVSMEEIHRFPNRRVTLGGTVYWDFLSLYAEVLAAIRACAGRGGRLSSMSVDTWGVDFGLLGGYGRLLGNPVSYRDRRTENIHAYSDPKMSRAEIFRLTGYEPWAISSLFQLLAMQRDRSPLLMVARTFLNMPDLFQYFLTGVRASEMSIANTSNLMDANCRWCRPVIEAFGLPEMFAELIEPATVLGGLTEAVRQETGLLADVPVIATCGHDTSAALAAVPAEGDGWAFISCGTWSILGSLVKRPITAPKCLELGFTNEYTIGGWYVARNISGLWLVQELRRKWDTPTDPWDYVRMTAEAAREEDGGPLLDAADASLMAPADMEAALLALVARGGQAAPRRRGQLVRGVLESLALEYNRRLDSLGELTGRRAEVVYIVGGGIHNKLLCQLTADACGCVVQAGADQCTALGNALGQALALGILKRPADIRRVMRASTEMATYEPRGAAAWAEKRERYARLCATG